MRVIEASAVPGAEYVRYGSSYALPERFTATIEPDSPDLPVCHLEVSVEHGRAVCDQLRVGRSPSGQPITGTALRRIPVGEYTRLAAGTVARLTLPAQPGAKVTVRTEEGEFPIDAVRVDDETVAIPVGGLDRTEKFTAEHQATRRKRGSRITDDDLRKVRDIYRAAYAERRAPTEAVAREMYVSRSTAARYVQRARERGFLRPTRPRVAGEEAS